MTIQVQPDFTLTYKDGDSLGRLRPNNDSAQRWLEENAQSEPWQWLGRWLCIEHRYITDIVAGIRDEGFTVNIQP